MYVAVSRGKVLACIYTYIAFHFGTNCIAGNWLYKKHHAFACIPSVLKETTDSWLDNNLSVWHCALTVTVYSVSGRKPVIVNSFFGWAVASLCTGPLLLANQVMLYSRLHVSCESKHWLSLFTQWILASHIPGMLWRILGCRGLSANAQRWNQRSRNKQWWILLGWFWCYCFCINDATVR